MCSVDDDVFEDTLRKFVIKESKITPTVCNKCRTDKPRVVLRNKDAYCKNCFLSGTTHKFKAILGKSHLVRPYDHILVHYQIGHPITALLHLLKSGLNLNTPKKLKFFVEVIYIDDQYYLDLEERQCVLKKVLEEIGFFGFKCHLISFSGYVLNPDKIDTLITDDSISLRISEDDFKDLANVIDRKAGKSNKQDILNIFRRDLLIEAAKYLNCKFVFTPETSADTASQLLTNIALGRGTHVPVDIGFCDDRDDIKILRPLRLFNIKELAFYNHFNDTHPISIKRLEVDPHSSVQALMRKFVSNLQINYPSTVSTILKIGDKLSVHSNGKGKCKLCKGCLPCENTQLSSEESTNFSHLISTKTIDYTLSGQERYQNLAEKFVNTASDENLYCYTCRKVASYIFLK